MDRSVESTIEFAKKYLEDILSFYGVNTEIEAFFDDDVLQLHVPTTDESSILIGRNAETLRALQYMMSSVLHNQGYSARVNIDIADYKKQRADKIAEQTRGWIDEVRKTGDSHIAHLNPADRRVVHRVAAEYSDIRTFSEGEGRERYIVISQASS